MKIYFKENLIKLRKDKGLQQKDLAKILNVARTTVSAWELGRNEPSLETFALLADFFNIDERIFLREKL
jgi:transcriptional regulator with XRE-family HTH domain